MQINNLVETKSQGAITAFKAFRDTVVGVKIKTMPKNALSMMLRHTDVSKRIKEIHVKLMSNYQTTGLLQ